MIRKVYAYKVASKDKNHAKLILKTDSYFGMTKAMEADCRALVSIRRVKESGEWKIDDIELDYKNDAIKILSEKIPLLFLTRNDVAISIDDLGNR